jgi:hypothetical protein
MSATMECPKCQTVTTGDVAGKTGFSLPIPCGPLQTPTPVRYYFKCRNASCQSTWYPDASEVIST